MKSKNITYSEFKRRVFNEVILESMCRLHCQILNGACGLKEAECNPDEARYTEMARKMCTAFYKNELNLDTATVGQTKKRLSETNEFLKDVANTAEDIAEDKAEAAREEKMEIPEDQKVELSTEDKAVLDQLFDTKGPTPEVDKIRDATVAALVAEDKKAEEVRKAVDIAQSQVASGDATPEYMEETVNRLNRIGPTSLMNAIMNQVSVAAVKDVSKNGKFTSVGKVMAENADEIKTRAVAIYALYESANVFGIHKYTPADVKHLALNIYYEK